MIKEKLNSRRNLFALIFCASGVVLDTGSTFALIKKEGFSEANPIVFIAIELGGVAGLLFLKLLTLVAVFYVFENYVDDEEEKGSLAYALALAGGVWLLAGLWNLSLLLG